MTVVTETGTGYGVIVLPRLPCSAGYGGAIFYSHLNEWHGVDAGLSRAASAVSPNATNSANAPNNGIVNPCRTTPDPDLDPPEDISIAIEHALG